jgi:hypothetical protein
VYGAREKMKNEEKKKKEEEEEEEEGVYVGLGLETLN